MPKACNETFKYLITYSGAASSSAGGDPPPCHRNGTTNKIQFPSHYKFNAKTAIHLASVSSGPQRPIWNWIGMYRSSFWSRYLNGIIEGGRLCLSKFRLKRVFLKRHKTFDVAFHYPRLTISGRINSFTLEPPYAVLRLSSIEHDQNGI